MANERRAYSVAQEVALTTQVGGFCPLCDQPLFYVKKSRNFKRFELAHIYPLNPKPEEQEELAGVELLHKDVNHPDNIIPLCTDCHTRFDKPRTRGEYDELAAKKREAIADEQQRILLKDFPIEDDIHQIVQRLHDLDIADQGLVDLEYDPKTLLAKFDETLPHPTRHKIRQAVSGYYRHIRREFTELERLSPTASTLIFSQVRTYYLKQKSLGLNQLQVFRGIVRWITVKANPKTSEAAELIAAFFVQNCEVFE